MRRALSALLTCAAAALGCADDDVVTQLSITTPRALLACAVVPADLQARMWISGSKVPCGLQVDVEAGTTTGSCDTRPGLVRTLTLDWFVPRADIDLLLAQARVDVDLTQAAQAEAQVVIADEDIVTSGCLDATLDQLDGAPTIFVAGAEVPVCDVDNSCETASGPCGNLEELCAASDPFDAANEP